MSTKASIRCKSVSILAFSACFSTKKRWVSLFGRYQSAMKWGRFYSRFFLRLIMISFSSLYLVARFCFMLIMWGSGFFFGTFKGERGKLCVGVLDVRGGSSSLSYGRFTTVLFLSWKWLIKFFEHHSSLWRISCHGIELLLFIML